MSKRKKVVKQRGHRTHGWGNPKKHRGTGSRGGTGKTGKFGHMMTRILKKERERIGYKGFKSKTGKDHKTINLNGASRLAGKDGKVDLGSKGYDKLLGRGSVGKALEIKVDYYSKSAKEKVEAAGGKIVSDVPEALTEESVPEEEQA